MTQSLWGSFGQTERISVSHRCVYSKNMHGKTHQKLDFGSKESAWVSVRDKQTYGISQHWTTWLGEPGNHVAKDVTLGQEPEGIAVDMSKAKSLTCQAQLCVIYRSLCSMEK